MGSWGSQRVPSILLNLVECYRYCPWSYWTPPISFLSLRSRGPMKNMSTIFLVMLETQILGICLYRTVLWYGVFAWIVAENKQARPWRLSRSLPSKWQFFLISSDNLTRVEWQGGIQLDWYWWLVKSCWVTDCYKTYLCTFFFPDLFPTKHNSDTLIPGRRVLNGGEYVLKCNLLSLAFSITFAAKRRTRVTSPAPWSCALLFFENPKHVTSLCRS